MGCSFLHLSPVRAAWPSQGVWRGLAAALLLCCLATSAVPPTKPVVSPVCTIEIRGTIGPATADYVARAITVAQALDAQCLVVVLDTPGGLLDSTKSIVQSLLGSPVPVVVYVAPAGATAASAGCFITLAADVAAMAPATTIGAAHPVTIGAAGASTPDDPAVRQKLEAYTVSYIEAIAGRRQRNVEWARLAVRESASVTAERALELGVIDLVAADLPDLLRQIDGRQFSARTLATGSAMVRAIPRNARESVFQFLWRPEVMFLLMLVAIYGLIGELSNPGAIFPGVIGTIALLLVLYMASVLPVNIVGLALVVLAVMLFILDVFAPSHGVLTIGGIISFLLGALMMFDRAEPMLRLSLALVLPATAVTAAFFLFVVGKGLAAQRLPKQVGVESLLGRVATALTPISPAGGKLFIEGEYWNATSAALIPQGAAVRILAVRELTLTVAAVPTGAVAS